MILFNCIHTYYINIQNFFFTFNMNSAQGVSLLRKSFLSGLENDMLTRFNCIYAYMYIRIHIYLQYVCLYVYVCARMYIYMCECIHVYIFHKIKFLQLYFGHFSNLFPLNSIFFIFILNVSAYLIILHWHVLFFLSPK